MRLKGFAASLREGALIESESREEIRDEKDSNFKPRQARKLESSNNNNNNIAKTLSKQVRLKTQTQLWKFAFAPKLQQVTVEIFSSFSP